MNSLSLQSICFCFSPRVLALPRLERRRVALSLLAREKKQEPRRAVLRVGRGERRQLAAERFIERVARGAELGERSRIFGEVDGRFTALTTSIDKRFDEVSEAFIEQREYTELGVGQLRTEMNDGFNKLDRKLDRVLATLTRTLSPRRRPRS